MARRLGKNGAGTDKPKTRKPRAPNAASSAAPAQSNVTDDTIRDLCREALDKKTAHEKIVAEAKTANAEYRAVLKKAKKLGVMPEAIIVWLNDRKLEIGDVSARIAQQNRIYKCMKLPVGTQLGFDLDGKSIATAIEDGRVDAAKADSAEAAYDESYDLGKAGQPLAKGRFDEDSKHWPEALRGYSAGQKDLAKTGIGRKADDLHAH